jgi:hypothetical protein
MKERLERFRSARLFLDICVRCGACADKCHYFIGSGDPKNMPVLRTSFSVGLSRSFTFSGRCLAGWAEADRRRLGNGFTISQCSGRAVRSFCP